MPIVYHKSLTNILHVIINFREKMYIKEIWDKFQKQPLDGLVG